LCSPGAPPAISRFIGGSQSRVDARIELQLTSEKLRRAKQRGGFRIARGRVGGLRKSGEDEEAVLNHGCKHYIDLRRVVFTRRATSDFPVYRRVSEPR
jgi:hypothetical protein